MKGIDKISSIYREQIARLTDSQSHAGHPLQLKKAEMDDMWGDIRSELDIEDVWSKVASGLDVVMPPDKGPGIFFKGCAAVLLILAGLIPVQKAIPDENLVSPGTAVEFILEEKADEPVSSKEVAETGTYRKEEKSNDNVLPADQAEIVDGRGQNGKMLPAKATVQQYAGENSTESLADESEGIMTDRVSNLHSAKRGATLISFDTEIDGETLAPFTEVTPASRAGIGPVASSTGPEVMKVAHIPFYGNLQQNESIATARVFPVSVDAGRFTIGLITSFKNTWLLNQETFNGLRSESLNSTEIIVFPDAGLSLGYSFTGSWSVQAEAYLCSNTGQEYYDYIYGHYSRKRIVLRYSTVALSVKYNTGGERGPENRTSINLLAGGYLSYLHNADRQIDADIEKIRSHYRTFDLGVRLGCEFELHLNNHLSVAPGLSFSMGLANIYKGTGDVPGYLRKTYNGSAVFHLSFYYCSD